MFQNTQQPIRLAICDDEALDLAHIAALTADVLRTEHIHAAITRFDSGTALLRAIEDGASFHLLLLDVVMDELDGMALAAALRKQNNDAAIIFISVNREMALRGYEVQAARYLAKPLDKEQLREALLYCYPTCFRQKETLLPTEEGESRVRIADILYAESQIRNTVLTLTSGKLTVNMMISELAAMLQPDQFIFCHRTVLINLDFVQRIYNSKIELTNGESLPISRYRLPEVKAKLIHYLKH